jgi:hypothetical protein
MVTASLDVPPALVALQMSVVPAVSAVMFVSTQPVVKVMADSDPTP